MRPEQLPGVFICAEPHSSPPPSLNAISSIRKDYLMPRKRDMSADRFGAERRKIQTSGIHDALIEYAEGRREMSASQVSAALGLLKKALPDLSTLALPDESNPHPGDAVPEKRKIEFRIVDPPL